MKILLRLGILFFILSLIKPLVAYPRSSTSSSEGARRPQNTTKVTKQEARPPVQQNTTSNVKEASVLANSSEGTNPADDTQKTDSNKQPKQDFFAGMSEKLNKELSGNENPEKRAAGKEDKPSWAWQIVRTIIGLSIVLTIFYIGYRIFLFKRKLPRQNSGVMKVIYDFPLTPGKIIKVVEMNHKLMLIGVSDAGIQLISEITDHNQVEQIRLDCARESEVSKPDFMLELTKAIKNKITDFTQPKPKNINTQNKNEPWESFRNSTRSKLSDLSETKETLNQENDQW